jgi:Protein of unknown function (DUF3574)
VALCLGVALVCLPASAAPPCPTGFEARQRVELFFGRNIGETLGVSDDAWAKFVDEEVTPKFPDGLSVLDLAGQWKDPASGRIVREPGKLLILIVAPDAALRAHVATIIATYKSRHRQQAVLMSLHEVCVAF